MLRFLACLLAATSAFATSERILLTPQRLHRLQRERERDSPRWQAFAQRVQSVPNSSERGFELALYYVVAADEQRGREAVEWASAHPCELRQVALVMNWVATLMSDTQKASLTNASCPAASGHFERLRDELLRAEATGTSVPNVPALELTSIPQGAELYAMVEYLDVYRQMEGVDLRREQRLVFLQLPSLVLLSMRPDALNHPSWQQHAAALALVGIDPNLESSQFLQSWAMEDRFTLRDGPGIAYEFFWADPYLPGVGYENMPPWLYQSDLHQLYARSSWNADACWVHIAPGFIEQQNCPAGWSSASAQFADLVLQPITNQCVNFSGLQQQQTMLLHTSKPEASLRLYTSKDRQSVTSDAAGLWAVPKQHPDRACLER